MCWTIKFVRFDLFLALNNVDSRDHTVNKQRSPVSASTSPDFLLNPQLTRVIIPAAARGLGHTSVNNSDSEAFIERSRKMTWRHCLKCAPMLCIRHMDLLRITELNRILQNVTNNMTISLRLNRA